MRTSKSKYLLCCVCFMVTFACSFIAAPPLRPDEPDPTVVVPVPTTGTIIPPTTACDIIARESFTEVDDLHLLPKRIQALFDYPIANKGEPFNATDVIDLSKPLPGARFAIAGISARYALLAVERGGVAHSLETSLYNLTSQDLLIVQTWSLPAYPAYLNDLHVLESALCK